jgi:hypothetical protein
MLTAAIAAFAALPTGGVALFRGQPGGAGDVEVVDVATGETLDAPVELSGITLLALDFNGRTELDRLLPDRAKLRTDVPGASRVELPSGAGSLYHFSRPRATGGLSFGLFVIDAAGDARVVLELDGTGALGDQPPIVARVALAPSGTGALVATTLAAGGDLYEIDLATGAVQPRTASLPRMAFTLAGTHLAASWGVAATDTSILRFDRASQSDAEPLTFAGTPPAWFSGEIALSSNGLHAVTTAGDADGVEHVFAFGPSGDAVQVTAQPAAISGAGFEPEAAHGPFLAISDDGSLAAWRTEGASAEAFLARVPQPAPQPAVHLTSDQLYLDTLDEIGQFFFRPVTHALVLAVGETALAPSGIENLDYYSAALPASGGPSIANLTQTNGIAQPPFLVPSTLKPAHVMRVPGSDEVVFFNERSGGTGDLVAMGPAQVGARVLVPEVKSVDFLEGAGGAIFAGVRRAIANDPRELWRVDASLTAPPGPLVARSGASVLARAAARADGAFAMVERGANADYIWRFDPASAQLVLFSGRPLRYGPALDFVASGELAFGVGAGGLQTLYAIWPFGAPVRRLPVPPSPGFVLPGA